MGVDAAATSPARQDAAGSDEHRSFAEFLAMDPETQPQFAAIVLKDAAAGLCPFALLRQAQALVIHGGVLALSAADSSAAAESTRRRTHYFNALAAHFGFVTITQDSGYFVILRKQRSPRWTISVPADDDIGCRSLFHRSFGHEISPEMWAWKYADGRGRAVIARNGERIVAHYAGTSRRIAFMDTDLRALQVCDVMVDPAERAVMTRKGAFFQVASAWLEAYHGYYGDHSLAFGFPNRRAMRLGEALGLYTEVAQIAEVNWTPLEPRHGIATHAVVLDQNMDHSALFQSLWHEMRQDLADRIVVIRDPAYLTYRYFNHPLYRYVLLAIKQRLTGNPIGLVVLRPEQDTCRFIDFVGPVAEIPRALAHARRWVGKNGLTRLTGWITTRDADRFTAAGVSVHATGICVPCNTWSESPPPEQIRNRWWLTMGDTEFL